MIRVGTGISLKLSAGAAAAAAAARARDACGGASPDFALAFATTAWGSEIPDLLESLRGELGGAPTLGCCVEGLWGAAAGTSQNPGLAVMTLCGVEAQPVLLPGVAGHEAQIADEIDAHLPPAAGGGDLLLVLADSQALLADPLIVGLAAGQAARDGAVVAGLGASAAPGGAAPVWLDGDVEAGAVAAVRLAGAGAAHQLVARPYRVVTPLFEVTRARGNWILDLSGRPALQVYRELARQHGLEEPDRSLGQWAALMAPGLAPLGSQPAELSELPASPSGLIERSLIGIDPDRQAISVPALVESGARLAFGILDGVAARESLEEMAASDVARGGAFGLFLGGAPRGQAIFGGLESEARCLAAAPGATPTLGLHGAYRFGSSPEAGALEGPLSWSSLLVGAIGAGSD